MRNKLKSTFYNPFDFSSKPNWYYGLYRKEMIKYVPRTAKTILDVGCSSGLFGAQLKKVLGAEVWGIELNKESALKANAKLSKVLIGDINELIKDIPDSYFDAVVFNDVLEHLVDPFEVLLKMKKKLAPEGVIVCSLPNIRYIVTLKRLLINKQWKYEDSGIMDKTHLRFFTLNSIKYMFKSLNFEILKIEGINSINLWFVPLLIIITFGYFSDTKYQEFACVVKPSS